MKRRLAPEQWLGLALVLLVHALAGWALWHHRLQVGRDAERSVMVSVVAPQVEPAPPRREIPPPREMPRPVADPTPTPILATTPTNEEPAIAAAMAPRPVAEAPAPARAPSGPLALAAELAITCPERPAPAYPLPSRRLGENGTALVQVELDETGRVDAASIARSSGYPRLDEAALTAVRQWRCNPAQRDGRPVRATANQAFKFVLQGA